MERVTLELNYLEVGFLYALINEEAWDRMPRQLWLKLRILTTQAYADHEAFGKLAKKDIKKWSEELNNIKKEEK